MSKGDNPNSRSTQPNDKSKIESSIRFHFTRFDIIALLVVLILGLLKLSYPFNGDQALNTLMALKISHGEVMYRDLWDLKHPGIFLFFALAGSLFGFTEIGIHLFELLYLLCFSVVLLVALRGEFKNPVLASLSPILTVGMYYLVSGAWHLTQTEALVGFPLFLSLWFVDRSLYSPQRRRMWLFASGLAGGIVLLFKFLLLPILLAFWLTFLFTIRSQKQEKIGLALLQYGSLIISGVLLPLLAMLCYFIYYGILDLALWTFIQYPVLASLEAHLSLRTLARGIVWCITRFSPLIILGAIGAFARWSGHRNNLIRNLVLWVVLGSGVILIQRLSWWEYHFLLLLVPLGLLAAYGVDHLLINLPLKELPRKLSFSYILGIAGLVLFLAIGSYSLVGNSLVLARHGLAWGSGNQLEYQFEVDPTYQREFEEVKWLIESGSTSNDIYVFGDPLYYYLSGNEPTISLPATWFRALPEQWIDLLHQLDVTRPRYIFVASDAFEIIRGETTPKIAPYLERTLPFITDNYRLLRQSDMGDWYVLRTASPEQ